MSPHGEVIRATWRICVHSCACVEERVWACEISGLSIIFKVFAKPTKHTLLIYLIFPFNFCHVELFVLLFMRR